MMRVFTKRLGLVVLGALGTTILVSIMYSLVDPNLQHPTGHFVQPPFSIESAAIVTRLKPLQMKQSPESAVLVDENDRKQQKTDQINADVEEIHLKPPKPDYQLYNKEKQNPNVEKAQLGAIGPRGQQGIAMDDQGLIVSEPALKKKRVLDPAIVALKDKLHLEEFRLIDECPNRTTLAEYYWSRYKKPLPNDDSWDAFYAQIGSCDMYRENSQILQTLLDDISTFPIKSVVNMDGGTQIKLLLTFENGKRALFKPMRFSREYETDPNHFYFSDFERHHAEIAAFHLDKLLGFRRAVPTVGRVLNISSDLWAKADKSLEKTFFISPAKNLCFFGKCKYYCNITFAICGNPDLKEGSTQMFLPDQEIMPREKNRSPYRRTYSRRNQVAEWQRNATYCSWKVKNKPPFSNGRQLLDLVDLYIFDFLMGNQDRHHFETIEVFEGYPPPFVHFDHGRAFGKPGFDDMSILAPFTQCCILKPSTAKTLLNFYAGPFSLSEALRKSLSKDPLAPILAEKYLKAVDRRLEIVLRELKMCLEKVDGDYKKVVMTSFLNPDAPGDTEDEEEED